MKFIWGEKKRLSNLKKHGIDFADAKTVFDGVTVTFLDEKEDYGEPRQITLGILSEVAVVVVVHVDSENVIRVISIRKATKGEKRIYYEKISDQI